MTYLENADCDHAVMPLMGIAYRVKVTREVDYAADWISPTRHCLVVRCRLALFVLRGHHVRLIPTSCVGRNDAVSLGDFREIAYFARFEQNGFRLSRQSHPVVARWQLDLLDIRPAVTT